MSLEHFWGAQCSYHVFWPTNEEEKKKEKILTNPNLPRSILVDFRWFSDFSALVLIETKVEGRGVTNYLTISLSPSWHSQFFIYGLRKGEGYIRRGGRED